MNAPALAPDFAEPVEGWRVWHLIRDGGALRLRSVIKETVWAPGEDLVAECLRRRRFWRRPRPHDAPAADCECGIYGANLNLLGQYLNEYVGRAVIGRVIGRVSLWGSVIECERGWRASRAYPSRIYVPADAGTTARLAAEDVAFELAAYGVPLELLDVDQRHAPRALLGLQLV